MELTPEQTAEAEKLCDNGYFRLVLTCLLYEISYDLDRSAAAQEKLNELVQQEK